MENFSTFSPNSGEFIKHTHTHTQRQQLDWPSKTILIYLYFKLLLLLKCSAFVDWGNNQKHHGERTCVPVVFLCPSDFIVFSENVLSVHFNRMRDQCETMETNHTKTLLAESHRHNYSAASTLSILLFFSPFFSPVFISTEIWPYAEELQCPMFCISHYLLWVQWLIIKNVEDSLPFLTFISNDDT